MACIISLIDPTKNKAVKTLTIDENYANAEKKVKELNTNISKMKPNKKGFFWSVTTINV
jgi:predicted transcriptional regulator